MVPPSTFERIAGRNVFAGTHVSGGSLNVTIHEPSDPPQRREPFSTVPFLPDPDFIERPDIATWLHDALISPGSRAALVGLGGVGKSQIAIQYTHQIRQQSPSTYVFWVHAGTRARFEETYRDIANLLQLPRRHDPEVDVLRLVYDWLFSVDNGEWLMILDNADHVDVFYPKSHDRTATVTSTQRPLASLLPQSSNGRILVTSRSRDMAERLAGSSWNIRSIPPMDEGQALQLLKKRLRDKYEDEAAASLVRALDYIPLAITQAAAYLLRRWPRTSPSIYLKELRESEKKKGNLLYKDQGDLRRNAEATNSVVLTWQITFEQIQNERRSAAELLSFMSIFNPQGIPEWILRSYYRRTYNNEKTLYQQGGDDDDDSDLLDELDDDLETLRGYSLVAVTTQKDIYEMHALVQLCTQVWLSSADDIEKWRDKFLQVISKEYPTGDYKDWTRCQQLEPHITQIIETEPVNVEGKGDWARLLTNAGWYGWQMGRYQAAGAMLRRAVEIREKVLGREHNDTLLSITCTALVLRSQGKYEEAEQMNRRALDGYQNALGKDHPATLTSVSNLALVLQDQGKYEEAEQMNRRALDSREKALGKDHPDTLTSVSDLALILRYQGKYEEAEYMNRRALDGYQKALGKDHPAILTSVSNLALILRYQGKYEEAEQMNRRALDSREKALGKDHPDTLTSVGNLAIVLQYQGKYEEAEQMNRRALDSREKALGQGHPDTLASIYCLAYLYQRQERFEEAAQLYFTALDGYRKVLGPAHPTTLACEGHYASLRQRIAN